MNETQQKAAVLWFQAYIRRRLACGGLADELADIVDRALTYGAELGSDAYANTQYDPEVWEVDGAYAADTDSESCRQPHTDQLVEDLIFIEKIHARRHAIPGQTISLVAIDGELQL